jgi:predicted small lipoprotein YifL
MRFTARFAVFRMVPAFALLTALAACGVDGEPETPTRGALLPSDVIVSASPR